MGSRSSKSNNFFSLLKTKNLSIQVWLEFTSLTHEIYSHLVENIKSHADLENKIKVTRSNILACPNNIHVVRFSQTSPNDSRDIVHTRNHTNADKI